MTRINCIPVSELVNKHLLAEYREMPRLRHAYPRKSAPNIPSSYRMGRGHVTFFYNKGAYLIRRYNDLVAEMQQRGYTVNYPAIDLAHWPQSAMNDWKPTTEALAINRQRIAERLAASTQL